MAIRMREYAVHADFAHIRKYADADENLIHIIHIQIFAKFFIFRPSGMVGIRDGHADAGICGSCGLCAYSRICGCG